MLSFYFLMFINLPKWPRMEQSPQHWGPIDNDMNSATIQTTKNQTTHTLVKSIGWIIRSSILRMGIPNHEFDCWTHITNGGKLPCARSAIRDKIGKVESSLGAATGVMGKVSVRQKMTTSSRKRSEESVKSTTKVHQIPCFDALRLP